MSIYSDGRSGCSSNKDFSTNLHIGADKKFETIFVQKSVKNISIGNEVFESKLIANYQFCVRAVVLADDQTVFSFIYLFNPPENFTEHLKYCDDDPILTNNSSENKKKSYLKIFQLKSFTHRF